MIDQQPRAAEEARTRFERFVSAIRENGLDGAIIDSADSLRYLTGYSATAVMYQCVIATSDGGALGVVRELDAPVFEAVSWVSDFDTYDDWHNPLERVAAALAHLGLAGGTVGQEFAANFLTVRDQRLLQALTPTTTFVDLGDIVIEARAVKSEAEIGEHRRAAAIADLALAATVDAIAPGISDHELVAIGYQAALQAGADNNAPRLMLLGMGARSSHMHAGVSGAVVEAGQPVHIELMPQSNGYSSRLMRPAVLGVMPREMQNTFKQLAEIQNLQLDRIRPGVTAREVDAVARKALINSGLRESVPNNTGYGLGLISAPKPGDFNHLFTPEATWELKENMVFHMYVSSSGIAVSETIRVTADGHERLTRTERTLKVMEAGA